MAILQAGKSVAQGTTGRDGRAEFRLRPGGYSVAVRKSGYEAPPSLFVNLTDQGASRQIGLRRISGSTLQVQVFGADENGVRLPVAGAAVVLRSGRQQILTEKTDSRGRCSFLELKQGDYELEARHQAFEPSRERVAVNQPVVAQTILLRRAPPMATVTLTVLGQTLEPRVLPLDRGPRPGARAATPKPLALRQLPLAGAEVTVLARGQKKPVAQGRTDRAGQYEVRLMPGDYRFSVTMQNYQPGSIEVTVVRGDDSQRIVLKPMTRPELRPEPR